MGDPKTGGDRIGEVLEAQGVRFVFTLCGGHISPILLGAKRRGIQVVDVRDEASAAFAADAVARLTGVPGVAAVTAGPGVTNTITAVKNAQMAQSPVVILGGATGTILKGRGSLQDIDQMALVEPHVKWCGSARRVRELVPLLEQAFEIARDGVPGPVFLECPVDLLYPEASVRELYLSGVPETGGLGARALRFYLERHLRGLFGRQDAASVSEPSAAPAPPPAASDLRRAVRRLRRAERPVLMIGSQALTDVAAVPELAAAVERLQIPVYLSGMGRGLLGRSSELQMRHHRRQALRRADLVLLAGVPCDFRLDYGRQIASRAFLISANRSDEDLVKNRRPNLPARCDAGAFLRALAAAAGPQPVAAWTAELRKLQDEREAEISVRAEPAGQYVNPLGLFREIEARAEADAVFVVDGGDFVATASYILAPRSPLSWLDPGVFGTLGVGGGFALGAALARPEAETWLVYGDGSSAYSLAEFDTFVRHGLGVIAVVGNDASWAQIARDQVEILGDDVGTVLRRTDYDVVAEGYGGRGYLVESEDQIVPAIEAAKADAAAGRPALLNVLLAKSDFRKGSLSM